MYTMYVYIYIHIIWAVSNPQKKLMNKYEQIHVSRVKHIQIKSTQYGNFWIANLPDLVKHESLVGWRSRSCGRYCLWKVENGWKEIKEASFFVLKKLVGNFSSFSWISDFLWSMATLSKPFFWLARGGPCSVDGKGHATGQRSQRWSTPGCRLGLTWQAQRQARAGRQAIRGWRLVRKGGTKWAAGILSSTCRLGKKGVPNPFPIWVLDKIRCDQSSIERVVVLPSQQNR